MTDGVRLEPQAGPIFWFQGTPPGGPGGGNGATANGNGRVFQSLGFNGELLVDVVEQAGGTATLTLEGSFWPNFTDALAQPDAHPLGYTSLAVAPRVVAVAAISVAANDRRAFLVLESYPYMRARISSIAGGAAVAVQLCPVPA